MDVGLESPQRYAEVAWDMVGIKTQIRPGIDHFSARWNLHAVYSLRKSVVFWLMVRPVGGDGAWGYDPTRVGMFWVWGGLEDVLIGGTLGVLVTGILGVSEGVIYCWRRVSTII